MLPSMQADSPLEGSAFKWEDEGVDIFLGQDDTVLGEGMNKASSSSFGTEPR